MNGILISSGRLRFGVFALHDEAGAAPITSASGTAVANCTACGVVGPGVFFRILVHQIGLQPKIGLHSQLLKT